MERADGWRFLAFELTGSGDTSPDWTISVWNTLPVRVSKYVIDS
jgi:hypothetical protein